MTIHPLAAQLLEAQLQFWLQQLSPAQLSSLLREDIAYLYQQMAHITLAEAVDAEKVKATAHRYALEMEIGGGIPELFGEIANLVYEHPAQDSTLFGEIFHHALAREFLEKAFESNGVVDRFLQNLQHSEPFQAFLTDVILLALKGYVLEENVLVRKIPVLGASLQKLHDLLDERFNAVQDNIASASRTLLAASIDRTLGMLDQLLDQDTYRDQALIATQNLWDEIRHQPVGRFREYTTEDDLQEWMVLGYEFWRAFRTTDYLKSIIDTAVDFVFDKYGGENLQKLLTDLGVTYSMIESEILHYADDLAGLLLQKGLAETLLRRHLARFYFNDATLALLDGAASPQPE